MYTAARSTPARALPHDSRQPTRPAAAVIWPCALPDRSSSTSDLLATVRGQLFWHSRLYNTHPPPTPPPCPAVQQKQTSRTVGGTVNGINVGPLSGNQAVRTHTKYSKTAVLARHTTATTTTTCTTPGVHTEPPRAPRSQSSAHTRGQPVPHLLENSPLNSTAVRIDFPSFRYPCLPPAP